MKRELIAKLVFDCINDFQNELDIKIDMGEGEQTRLFGGNGQLDSIALVSLIVNIEEAIENEFNVSVTLADEKAMSRRTSPFVRISSLIDYIAELLNVEA